MNTIFSKLSHFHVHITVTNFKPIKGTKTNWVVLKQETLHFAWPGESYVMIKPGKPGHASKKKVNFQTDRTTRPCKPVQLSETAHTEA